MRLAGFLALASTALVAVAGPITSLPEAQAIAIPVEAQTGAGPFTLAPGVVLTSSSPNTRVGWTAAYDFGSNGSWSGTPMVGLGAAEGGFDIRFDNPISGFLADVNWTTGEHNGNAGMAAYDVNGLLLESLIFEKKSGNEAAPGFHGFLRASEDIAFLRFSNEFIGLRHLTVTGFQQVPEPATLALAGLALLGVGAVRRRAST